MIAGALMMAERRRCDSVGGGPLGDETRVATDMKQARGACTAASQAAHRRLGQAGALCKSLSLGAEHVWCRGGGEGLRWRRGTHGRLPR